MFTLLVIVWTFKCVNVFRLNLTNLLRWTNLRRFRTIIMFLWCYNFYTDFMGCCHNEWISSRHSVIPYFAAAWEFMDLFFFFFLSFLTNIHVSDCRQLTSVPQELSSAWDDISCVLRQSLHPLTSSTPTGCQNHSNASSSHTDPIWLTMVQADGALYSTFTLLHMQSSVNPHSPHPQRKVPLILPGSWFIFMDDGQVACFTGKEKNDERSSLWNVKYLGPSVVGRNDGGGGMIKKEWVKLYRTPSSKIQRRLHYIFMWWYGLYSVCVCVCVAGLYKLSITSTLIGLRPERVGIYINIANVM